MPWDLIFIVIGLAIVWAVIRSFMWDDPAHMRQDTRDYNRRYYADKKPRQYP
jgi:hypothetical protein